MGWVHQEGISRWLWRAEHKPSWCPILILRPPAFPQLLPTTCYRKKSQPLLPKCLPRTCMGRRGSRKQAGRFPWLFFPDEFPITPWDEQSPGCRAGSSRLECCLAPLPHASDVQDEVLLLSRNKFNPLEDSGGNRCHLTCPSHGFASVLGRRGAGLGSSSAPAIATLTACICLLPLARLQKSLSSR